MMFNPTHVLVDGSSFLYRAYYSSMQKSFTNEKGEPIGAIMIFAKMIQALRTKYANVPFIMVFDAPTHCFRYDLFPDYKANRKRMPDDLRVQCERIKLVSKAMGCDVLTVPGVEADDVIGSYATVGSEQGANIIICSGDKDLFQLVNKNIVIENTMTNEIIDESYGFNKYGVKPIHMVDLLALVGDSADNIPGMPKTGEKTALNVINNVGGIVEIENNPQLISSLNFRGANSFHQRFLENIDLIKLSYTLALIKRDVNLPIPFKELEYHEPNIEALKKLYLECGLKELYTRLGNVPVTEKNTDNIYGLVSSISELKEIIELSKQNKKISISIITDNENYMENVLLGISLSVVPTKAWYIPLRVNLCDSYLSLQEVRELLNEILQDEGITKVIFNYKYLLHIFDRNKIIVKGLVWDPKLEFWLLDSSRGRFELSDLSFSELQIQLINLEDVLGKGKNKKTFNDIDANNLISYSAQLADISLRLHNCSYKKLEDNNLVELYVQHYFPMTKILFLMEENGALISSDELMKVETIFLERLKDIETRIYLIAGHSFNISSPKQVAEVLFDEQKMLPSDFSLKKKVLAGKYTTNEDMLTDLSEKYELPILILEYRGLAKLINTYTSVLPKLTYRETNRLHTTFHQTGTSTGRLSSSDPNLQNIPIRTNEGKQIRKAFVARPGYKILAADYSQIELRILAHLCQDHNMINAFCNGADIHRSTAAEILGIPFDDVTTDQRRSAKAINFGIVYGMSAFGLAKQLKIDRKMAQQYIDSYFNRYPLLKNYLTEIVVKAKSDGFVSTVTNRKIKIKDINSKQIIVAKAAERVATNAPMQGSAADIIQLAMIKISDFIKNEAEKDSIFMILQVHDELVFEVREDLVEKYALIIQKIMSNSYNLSVPLDVGIGIADDWQTAH